MGLAFDGAGYLYASDWFSDSILKYTPGGSSSTFASGFNDPYGLTFDPAGNLYEANSGNGTIYKIMPDGTSSLLVTGLTGSTYLTFMVPEPSTCTLLGFGLGLMSFLRRRRKD
jgi:DNA-binding beta-propeller fold protein YncE